MFRVQEQQPDEHDAKRCDCLCNHPSDVQMPNNLFMAGAVSLINDLTNLSY